MLENWLDQNYTMKFTKRSWTISDHAGKGWLAASFANSTIWDSAHIASGFGEWNIPGRIKCIQTATFSWCSRGGKLLFILGFIVSNAVLYSACNGEDTNANTLNRRRLKKNRLNSWIDIYLNLPEFKISISINLAIISINTYLFVWILHISWPPNGVGLPAPNNYHTNEV